MFLRRLPRYGMRNNGRGRPGSLSGFFCPDNPSNSAWMVMSRFIGSETSTDESDSPHIFVWAGFGGPGTRASWRIFYRRKPARAGKKGRHS